MQSSQFSGGDRQENQVTIHSPIPNPMALPASALTRTGCSPHCSLSQPVKREVRTCHSSAQPPPVAPCLKRKAGVLAVTCKACMIYFIASHSIPRNAPFQLHWLFCCFSTCQACSCLKPLHLPLVLLETSSPRYPCSLPAFTQVPPPQPGAFLGCTSKYYSLVAFCSFICFINFFFARPSHT